MFAENCMAAEFELVKSCGRPCLFTEYRVDRKSVPDGLFCAELREDDYGQGIACSAEPYVWVNFCGTLISKQPIEMTDHDSAGRPYRNLIQGVMTPPPEEIDGCGDAFFAWREAVDEDLMRTGIPMTAQKYMELQDRELQKLLS